MLDRSVPPISSGIGSIDILKASTVTISDGEVPFHFLNAGQEEVFKFELTTAPTPQGKKDASLVMIVAKMLSKGTATRTAAQLQDELDFIGAFIGSNIGLDRTSISIYCLTRHFEKAISLFVDMLENSVLPQEELDILISRTSQELKVNMGKTSYVASRELRNKLYPDHPYGLRLKKKVLKSIDRSDVLGYYKDGFFQDVNLYLSGKVSEKEIGIVDKHFRGLKVFEKSKTTKNKALTLLQPVSEQFDLHKKGAVQASIRLGKQVISKSHKDYHAFFLTNQLFGGFFGSRLMKNVREDKGLTYGIYSSLVHADQSSFLVVGAEVAKEKVEDALREINFEIDKLKEQPVTNSELEVVRNYTLGKFVMGMNTPFSLMEKFKSIYHHGLEYSFYEEFIRQTREITTSDLKTIAEQYYDSDQMLTVVVGDLS